MVFPEVFLPAELALERFVGMQAHVATQDAMRFECLMADVALEIWKGDPPLITRFQ